MKKKKIILTGAAVAAVVVIGIGAWTLFGRKSSDGSNGKCSICKQRR